MPLRTSLDRILRALSIAAGVTPLVACGASTSLDGVGTGGRGNAGSCENPAPVRTPTGEATGFVQCADGTTHRTEIRGCPEVPSTCTPPSGCSTGTCMINCTTDADCTAQPHGHCGPTGAGAIPGCYCSYGCTSDAECGAGMICQCSSAGGQCVTASCGSDAACPDGFCTSYFTNPGCPGVGFACQTAADQCHVDADCTNGQTCWYDGTKRICQGAMCVVGRPFLVNGVPRLAPAARRDDFRSALAPCLSGLDARSLEVLAARWTEIGLMEHASIAAFARFSMDLLAAGAPSELLEEAHRAMADETRHARDAFALASAYAGHGVGPGALVVGGSDAGRTLRDVVETAILEGCIGETIAAAEAAEASARATDTAVREALARVSEDETRHAELAWRFVRWSMGAGDAEWKRTMGRALLALVAAETRSVEEAPRRSPRATPADERLAAHGVLAEPVRDEIRRRVLRDVVVPCARALTAPFIDPAAPRAA